ncbi:MAG: DUF2066 domain-containing protein [Alphaproteobacteria bacterium]|nr:DUF2066 domain-containing protein [Alphaproteobacteria bacterium]
MIAAMAARGFAALLLLVATGCAPVREPPIATLYEGKAIVTGTDERSRPRGIAEAFEDVLVKLSGDPRLHGDPRVAAAAAQAGALVTEIAYRDRMEGFPIHDEQGTRDRPYDMTVRFDPARVDAALRALGRAPWLAPRPRLGVVLAVQIGATRYVLADAGERGFDQRNALLDAAARRGMPIALPSPATLTAAQLRADDMPAAELARLDALARGFGADRALAGRMVWNVEALAWRADWRLTVDGVERRWQAREATFDEAFRSAIGIAAQILSGNG